MSQTNITAEHKAVFDLIRGSKNKEIALFSCFVNGEPTVAIVKITQIGDNYNIDPLLVFVTPSMTLTDHDDVSARLVQ